MCVCGGGGRLKEKLETERGEVKKESGIEIKKKGHR